MDVMQSEVEVALRESSQHSSGNPRRRSERRRTHPDQEPKTMKKYTKLLLAIVAVISSLFFIIYKYRYDRLYHVMQVLEVFGSPDQSGGSSLHSYVSSITVPSWQNMGQGVWIYAAYCSSACSQVIAIGFMTQTVELKCSLWYEGATQPLQGILSVTTDDSNASIFTCESKYPDKTPFALSVHKDKVPEYQIQIQLPESSDSSPMNICILPEPVTEGDNSQSIRENLIFHSFIGVSNLRVYASSVSKSVINTINKLKGESKTNIEIVPWNPPVILNSTLIQNLLSKECYYLSQNSFNFYSVLNTKQLLMPLKHESLEDSLKQITKSSSTGPQKLPVKIFCSEYPTEKKAKNLSFPVSLLQSTWYNKQMSEEAVGSINKLMKGGGEVVSDNIGDIGDIVSINEYKACDKYDFSETDKSAVYEGNALRFQSSLVSFYKKFI